MMHYFTLIQFYLQILSSIGPPGLIGPVGLKGNQGPLGSPGIDGFSGRDGEKGDRGFNGKERYHHYRNVFQCQLKHSIFHFDLNVNRPTWSAWCTWKRIRKRYISMKYINSKF